MTTTSIDIDQPAAEVFAYVTDPTHFHEWQQGVVSGGMKEPGTPTVGSHCTMTRLIGGANRPFHVGGDQAEPTHFVGCTRHRRAHPRPGRRHRRSPW